MTGLFGGAFDPPHNGHVALVGAALARFDLERLVIVVTGEPPHKETDTDPWQRYRLAEAAFGGTSKAEVSAHEIEREGPSFTVDTVRWAASVWPDVIFLVGADEFADFLSWKDPKEVLRYARLGVATRPGYRRGRLEPVLAQLDAEGRVDFFEIPAVDVSSREIRARVARGEPIGDAVPEAVAREIEVAGLYR
jgi:nicotinate-nucleotide adenylyltransferase